MMKMRRSGFSFSRKRKDFTRVRGRCIKRKTDFSLKPLVAAALLVTAITCFAGSEKIPDFLKVGSTYEMGINGLPIIKAKILADKGDGWYFIEFQRENREKLWLNVNRVDFIWPESVPAGGTP